MEFLLYVTFHIDHHPRSLNITFQRTKPKLTFPIDIYIYTRVYVQFTLETQIIERYILMWRQSFVSISIYFIRWRGLRMVKLIHTRVKHGRWYFCPTGQTCVKYNVNYIIWQFHWLHVYISPNYALYPSARKPHCSYALRNELVITRLRHVPFTYFSYNLSPCMWTHLHCVTGKYRERNCDRRLR